MNELYRRDKLARNDVDFEGCGVGDGHYSAYAERKEKFNDMKLPIIIVCVMLAYWYAVIYITVGEINLVKNSEKFVLELDYMDLSKTCTSADGEEFQAFPKEEEREKGEMVFYYVKGEKIHRPESVITWVTYYGFGIIVTVCLAIWIYKIMFPKKHAIQENKEKHSYKSYNDY